MSEEVWNGGGLYGKQYNECIYISVVILSLDWMVENYVFTIFSSWCHCVTNSPHLNTTIVDHYLVFLFICCHIAGIIYLACCIESRSWKLWWEAPQSIIFWRYWVFLIFSEVKIHPRSTVCFNCTQYNVFAYVGYMQHHIDYGWT